MYVLLSWCRRSGAFAARKLSCLPWVVVRSSRLRFTARSPRRQHLLRVPLKRRSSCRFTKYSPSAWRHPRCRSRSGLVDRAFCRCLRSSSWLGVSHRFHPAAERCQPPRGQWPGPRGKGGRGSARGCRHAIHTPELPVDRPAYCCQSGVLLALLVLVFCCSVFFCVCVCVSSCLTCDWWECACWHGQGIMRISSAVSNLFREFLVAYVYWPPSSPPPPCCPLLFGCILVLLVARCSRDFVEIQTPKILAGASEGGSSVFKYDSVFAP
jgi:hypothetical protein